MDTPEQNILKADQTTGEASTKLLAATGLLQDFGHTLNMIAQNPIMSGSAFVGIAYKIKQYYISALRESNDLTKEQVKLMEKVVNQTTNYARLGIVIGSISQSIASMNRQLRETALEMGHFSNLANLPGGAATALGGAKYQGIFRGNLLSGYNVATAEQAMQAYQQLFGQMTANGLSPAVMESLATLSGVYQVGAGVSIPSNVLNLQRTYGGIGTINNTAKQFGIQRGIANLVYKRGGLLSFSGDVGDMGRSLGNINQIAMGLIGTPGISNEEQAYAAAMRITGTLGNRGVGFGSEMAGNVFGAMKGIIGNPERRAAALALSGGGELAARFDRTSRVDDLLPLLMQAAKRMPLGGTDDASIAKVKVFGGILGLDRTQLEALANVKDYNKVQKEVNDALEDFAKGLKENPNLYKDYEQKLQDNIQNSRTLKDSAAAWRQKLTNATPDAMRDVLPISMEGLGLTIDAVSTLSQLYMLRSIYKGRGVPGKGRLSKIFSRGGAEVAEEAVDMTAAGSYNRAAEAFAGGKPSTTAKSTVGRAGGFLATGLYTAGALAAYNVYLGANKSIIDADRYKQIEKEVREKYKDHGPQPEGADLVTLKSEKNRYLGDSSLDLIGTNVPMSPGAGLFGFGPSQSQKQKMYEMATKDKTINERLIQEETRNRFEQEKEAQKALEESAGERTVIDLYIHTDDGNVLRREVEGNRAAIDFFSASNSTIPVYNDLR